MEPLLVSAFTCVNGTGLGVEPLASALHQQEHGLKFCDFDKVVLQTYTGQIAGIENRPIEGDLAHFDCRNNRVARDALAQDGFYDRVMQAKAQYGADRIAVIIGTSTTGIYELERAYRRRDPETGALPKEHEPRHVENHFAVTDFVHTSLGLEGPAYTVATACSSSAKVFASAYRMMAPGLCDAAVVGGVDSLCLQALFGFEGLQVLSPKPCTPFAPDRSGISIGEGGGLALVERVGTSNDHTGIVLLGYGESSDAFHMSSPSPDGAGAALSMRRALQRAALEPGDIDYINLHGTGTLSNDVAEDAAVMSVFGSDTPCSATKGGTGHTLAAAGIVESIIAMLALRDGFLPGTFNTRQVDEAMSINLLLDNSDQAPQRVLTNSFGFGGNNCSLIFGKVS